MDKTYNTACVDMGFLHKYNMFKGSMDPGKLSDPVIGQDLWS